MRSYIPNLTPTDKTRWRKTPKTKLRPILFFGLIAAAASFGFLGIAPWELLLNTQQIQRLLTELSAPNFSDWLLVAPLILETLLMALAGTLLGVVLAFPLGFMASNVLGFVRPVRLAAKAIIVITRAVPTLVFALIFVRLFGFGPMVGVLALAISSLGMIGRQFADALDNLPSDIAESRRFLGQNTFQFALSNLVPNILPSIVAIVFYRLEINLRSSSVLGFVGAGGVGILLARDLGQLNYSGAMGTVILVLAVLLAIEAVSSILRPGFSKRNRAASKAITSSAKRTDPAKRLFVAPLVFAIPSSLALVYLFFSSETNVRSIDAIQSILAKSWPPNFSDFSNLLVSGLVETIAIAIAGTSLGLLFAFPLAALAARNISPWPLMRVMVRFVMSLTRSLPDVVIALLFVVSVGLGPSAGVYAVALGTSAMLGRLLADVFEDTSDSLRQSFWALGSGSIKFFVSGVIPENGPRIVATVLHALDINIRVTISLGLVGVGGIGMLLSGAVSALAFDTALAILIVIVAAVASLENLSGRIKDRLR